MKKLPHPVPLFDNFELSSHIQTALKLEAFMQQDLMAALDFLKQYAGNKATFTAYRHEIERFLLWAWLVLKKSIFTLQRGDLEAYVNFCLNPSSDWIGTENARRYIGVERLPNPAWKPFIIRVNKKEQKDGILPNKSTYKPSQKAIHAIFTTISCFYNYLLLQDKISVNPVSLIKQKSKYLQKQQTQRVIRRLSDQQWEICLSVALEKADLDPKNERTLFILCAMYLLYLRVSEFVASDRWTPQMGHFYRDSNGAWWFKTVGKGNKMRDIAVCDDMISALKRYRLSLGLAPLPSMNEATPLLSKEKGVGAITSTQHIRRLIQSCFDESVERLRQKNSNDEADALELATVHWLRHTGISDDLNKRGRPTAHVRDDAGHSSSAITDLYNDIELMQRYNSAKAKSIS